MQIFPKEIIENTLEVHQFKHSTKSKIIYAMVTLVILFAIMALPFIKITVYNSSQGIIKPDRERIVLQANTSGEIITHQFIDNKKVTKGDTLLVLKNKVLQQKTRTLQYQIKETSAFINDLTLLLQGKHISKNLQSSKYQQEYMSYLQKREDLQTRFLKQEKDYNRDKNLFQKGVIAKVTLDDGKLAYDIALNTLQQLKRQQKSTWQSLSIDYINQLQELQNNLMQFEEEEQLTIIKAPISGTLFTSKGIETGSFMHSGTELAEISPNTNLLVECYLQPTDIGLLKKGNSVNFQVAAFNYNQWGLATGKIIAIANDVEVINNTPVFKVKCSLDQDHLQLTNGFKGFLKKGMTLNARFELIERTLFDLLYDKMDDWLNPTNGVTDTVAAI